MTNNNTPSFKNMRWNLLPQPDEQKIELLSQQLNNLDKTLTALLIQRGIDTFEKAKQFFRPKIEDLHDPFLMKGMKSAVKRLNKALQNNEKLLVYGDYDVDGTTSVALVYSFLKPLFKENISYYIPDRQTEGYGISKKGIDFAKNNGFSLIIALDCGIRAVDKVSYAKEKKVDFVICDHHLPGDTIPEAVAVLDPKQPGCAYPYKELSGCGVGFKLLQAFCSVNAINQKELFKFLDFLAISIAADIVPLTGENRVLARLGIEKINTSPLPGVKSLIELAFGEKKKILTISDVVFGLAPRINAAGRMEHANNAVKTLIAETDDKQFAKLIHEHNNTRRGLDKDITKQALELIKEMPENKTTTVVYHPDWHKGVVGIVASRLIETYYRPTIVLTKSDDGLLTGSARSVKGFSVYDAINKCAHLLEKFGGHKYAAGLSLKEENLHAFIDLFEETVSKSITTEQLIPEITIDNIIRLNQITKKFYTVLKQFAPFGPSNMRPVFLAKNVLLKFTPRVLKEEHLKLIVYQEDNPENTFEAIGFFMGKAADNLELGKPFDLVFNIEENEWNNRVSLQLNLKDIKIPNR